MVATLKQKHLINDTIQILREKYVKQSRHDISNKNDTPLDNINITDEANKLAAVHLMDGEATALNAALDSGRNRFKLKESVVAQLFSFEDAGNSNIAFTDEEGEEEKEEEKEGETVPVDTAGSADTNDDPLNDVSDIPNLNTFEFDDNILPENVLMIKLWASGTAIFQPLDICKSFQILKSLIQKGSGVLLMDYDDGNLPTWHQQLWNHLLTQGIPASRMRSIYQFCVNLPHWMDVAFRPDVGIVGWRLSGINPWNPWHIMNRWAGALHEDKLPDSLYAKIFVTHWEALCTKYTAQSTLYPEDILEIIGREYIEELHANRLSNIGKEVADNMIKRLSTKATSLRPLCQWGITTINNNFFRRRELERQHLQQTVEAQQRRNEATTSIANITREGIIDNDKNKERVLLMMKCIGLIPWEGVELLQTTDAEGVVTRKTEIWTLGVYSGTSYGHRKSNNPLNHYWTHFFRYDEHKFPETSPKNVGCLLGEQAIMNLLLSCRAARLLKYKTKLSWGSTFHNRRPLTYFCAFNKFMNERLRDTEVVKKNVVNDTKINNAKGNYPRWCLLMQKENRTTEEEAELKSLVPETGHNPGNSSNKRSGKKRKKNQKNQHQNHLLYQL